MIRASCLLLAGALASCGGGGGNGGPSGPPRITSVSPSPGSATGASPAEVEVRFDQAMDALTFRQQTFQLTWSGRDGSFSEGNEVTLQTLGLQLTSSRVAVLDLTALPPLPEDIYRLTLVGTGSPAILGASGEVLDGEYQGSFPSGNGIAGGDFTVFFQTSTAVLSMTPAPGSILSAAPSSIEVDTSPDVDPATVDANTFRLLGSGGDGNFHDGDEIEIAPASVSRVAAGRFRFALGSTVLPPDDYQVILAGAGTGMALQFDGTGDLATVPASVAFAPGSGSWCVECWVSLDDPAAASAMVSCADGNLVDGWLLSQDGS
ncbi:MAG: copper resistance CopC family protein, partial [Planctomycetota bacterium]